MNTDTLDSNSLLRLAQLMSPTLPVGAYAYSQGLEYAVNIGWIKDETSASDWIIGLLSNSMGRLDIPVFARLHTAWLNADMDSVHYWSHFLRASRESAEMQAEDRQLAVSLARLLTDLGIDSARPWKDPHHSTWATIFSLACVHWQIPLRESATGYLWAWTENQIAAAIKLVPLGQTAGQRILSRAIEAKQASEKETME